MVPQELHILLPYGPSPDTYNIGESWSLWHPVCYFVRWSACFGSPCMGIQHWILQQRSYRWRFGPGQSNHCGSLGKQEFVCLSFLSHDPCALGCWEHWLSECSVLPYSRQPSTSQSGPLALSSQRGPRSRQLILPY